MPALQPVNKTLKCTLHLPVTVRPSCQSRFYVNYGSATPTIAQLNTFATSIRTAWGTNLASLFSINTSLTQVAVQDLSSGGAQGFDNTAVAGTRAGVEAPIQSCVVINGQITRRYRGGKPKQFFNMGVQADQADVSHWTTAFTTAVATGWTAFTAAVVAAGWTGAGTLAIANVSYFQGFTTVTRLPFRARNVPNPRNPPLVDFINTFTVPTQMGSQRRRRAGA